MWNIIIMVLDYLIMRYQNPNFHFLPLFLIQHHNKPSKPSFWKQYSQLVFHSYFLSDREWKNIPCIHFLICLGKKKIITDTTLSFKQQKHNLKLTKFNSTIARY